LDETVDAILSHHDAGHIVVGHTPTSGVIWPRYDGKVVMIDTGIASAYGGNVAYLEITADGLFAGYPSGKLPLPSNDGELIPYLEKVIAMDPDNRHLKKRLKQLQHPAAPEPLEEESEAVGEMASEPEPVPICGISQ
jgi:hypothetical protein